MIKTIVSILVLSISFCSFSQPHYKEWNARNQVYNSAKDESSKSMVQALEKEVGVSIDSIVNITNVIEINQKKYACMNALVSRVFDLESIIAVNSKSNFDISELENDINARKDLLKTWKNKYATIYGEDNVLIDSVDGFSIISNIPIKIYCAYITDREEIADQWVYIPDTKNVSILLLAPDKEKGMQKVLDRQVPSKIRAEFDETKPFFKPAIFENDFSLLSTKELDKSLLYFIDACNEGNAEFELKMTHPKFLSFVMSMSEKQKVGSSREILSTGILRHLSVIEKPISISEIIENKGIKYAKIVLSGGPKISFGKYKNEESMTAVLGAMYMKLKSQYGEENVTLDKKNWILTIRNQELYLYAIYDSNIDGWQFSMTPYIPQEENNNIEFIKNSFSSAQKITSKYLDSLSKSVDFIVPKEVLLKFN